MPCEEIVPELIGFHFGTLDPKAREQVEGHLLGCAGCLRIFLSLKHDAESPEDDREPSPAARQRLRRAVLQELRAAASPPRRWWETPVALAIGAAAALVAVLVVHGVAAGPGAPPRGPVEAAPLHAR